jgi:hypothetical protein
MRALWNLTRRGLMVIMCAIGLSSWGAPIIKQAGACSRHPGPHACIVRNAGAYHCYVIGPGRAGICARYRALARAIVRAQSEDSPD